MGIYYHCSFTALGMQGIFPSSFTMKRSHRGVGFYIGFGYSINQSDWTGVSAHIALKTYFILAEFVLFLHHLPHPHPNTSMCRLMSKTHFVSLWNIRGIMNKNHNVLFNPTLFLFILSNANEQNCVKYNVQGLKANPPFCFQYYIVIWCKPDKASWHLL